MPQPILIIGGGLGGLTLGQGLRKIGLPFQIFERDASIGSRPQGYRIKINGEGLEALKASLEPDIWSELNKTFASEDGKENSGFARIDLQTGEQLPALKINRPMPSTQARAADRTTMRRVLMRGIEEHISFGRTFTGYDVTEDGVKASFDDGSSAFGSLLVGAEGVHSAVRKLYAPDIKLLNTEGCCIYGKTPLDKGLLSRISPHIMQRIGGGRDETREHVLTILTEPIIFDRSAGAETPLPADYVYWVLVSKSPTFGALVRSNEEAADVAMALTRNYHPSVRAIWESQDRSQTSMLSIAMAHPDQPPRMPGSRVTLLGDAAHVMPPTGGLGSTAVFRDVARLCPLLERGEISRETIGEYEAGMLADAKRYCEFSVMGAKHMFGMRDLNDLPALKL